MPVPDELRQPIEHPIESHAEAESDAEGADEEIPSPNPEPRRVEVVSPEADMEVADGGAPAEPPALSRGRSRSVASPSTRRVLRPPIAPQPLQPVWCLFHDSASVFTFNAQDGHFQGTAARSQVGADTLWKHLHRPSSSSRPLSAPAMPNTRLRAANRILHCHRRPHSACARSTCGLHLASEFSRHLCKPS